MILIFDNGYDYSDHTLHFIDIGNIAVEHAVALCKMRYGCGHLLGCAERIEWRECDATDDLIDFVCTSLPGADEAAPLPDVPRELLMRAYEREKTRLSRLMPSAYDHVRRNLQARMDSLEVVRARIEGDGR